MREQLSDDDILELTLWAHDLGNSDGLHGDAVLNLIYEVADHREREAVSPMTSSEKVREEISRVLCGAGLTDKPAEFDSSIHSWRCEYPDRYGACDCFDELVSDLEKAILARFPVLAGVTDEQVEAGARALWDARRSPTNHTWDDIAEGGLNRPYPTYPHIVDDIRREARAVLSAALGPRPGDGSTTDA